MTSRLAKLAEHLLSEPPHHPTPAPAAAGGGGIVITEVESFTVECPLTAEQQRIMDEGVAEAARALPGRSATKAASRRGPARAPARLATSRATRKRKRPLANSSSTT